MSCLIVDILIEIGAFLTLHHQVVEMPKVTLYHVWADATECFVPLTCRHYRQD